MDNITVIVDNTIQETTVQVVTTGITVDQANQIVVNTQKVGYTDALVDANSSVVANTAKVGITNDQANEIIANNAKVGITSTQANEIIANNAKVSDINHVTIELPNVDNTSDANKPVSTAQATAIGVVQTDINNHEADSLNPHSVTKTQVGLSNVPNTNFTSAVGLNTAKVGITTQQASDITTNNAKVGYTETLVTNNTSVAANTLKVGITTQQASDIVTNNAKVSDINHVTSELPNVDNTSDANKPVSTATQTALDLKVDTTDATITTTNIFKSVSFTMDFSDRVVADGGTIQSRNCVMNEYLKILN
jgi:trimeric autotransporter adhesin